MSQWSRQMEKDDTLEKWLQGRSIAVLLGFLRHRREKRTFINIDQRNIKMYIWLEGVDQHERINRNSSILSNEYIRDDLEYDICFYSLEKTSLNMLIMVFWKDEVLILQCPTKCIEIWNTLLDERWEQISSMKNFSISSKK